MGALGHHLVVFVVGHDTRDDASWCIKNQTLQRRVEPMLNGTVSCVYIYNYIYTVYSVYYIYIYLYVYRILYVRWEIIFPQPFVRASPNYISLFPRRKLVQLHSPVRMEWWSHRCQDHAGLKWDNHWIGGKICTGNHNFQMMKCVCVCIYIYPIGSMYAIYGNIYHQYTPNVSIYTMLVYIPC